MDGSEVVSTRGGYVITHEKNRYWSRYNVWSPDGVVLHVCSSHTEAIAERARLIEIDLMAGDLDYE